MTLDEFVIKALPVPFKDGGRGYDGWDCWGMVRCCYRDVYGIDLPSYSGYYEGTSVEEVSPVVEAAKCRWRQIETPKKGCVAVLKLWCSRTNRHQPTHVGIMLDGYSMLHTERNRNAFVEDLTRPMWAIGTPRSRVDGFFEWRGDDAVRR